MVFACVRSCKSLLAMILAAKIQVAVAVAVAVVHCKDQTRTEPYFTTSLMKNAEIKTFEVPEARGPRLH